MGKISIRKSWSKGFFLYIICTNELHLSSMVSVWWDDLQAQVKNRLHCLQPEPCNDKAWNNASSVVTVQLPSRTPRCEIKDTSPKTKLSMVSISRQGRGNPNLLWRLGSLCVKCPQGQQTVAEVYRPLSRQVHNTGNLSLQCLPFPMIHPKSISYAATEGLIKYLCTNAPLNLWDDRFRWGTHLLSHTSSSSVISLSDSGQISIVLAVFFLLRLKTWFLLWLKTDFSTFIYGHTAEWSVLCKSKMNMSNE